MIQYHFTELKGKIQMNKTHATWVNQQEVSNLLILLREEERTLSRIVDESWMKRGVTDATRNQLAGEAYAYFDPRIAKINTRIAAISNHYRS